MGKKRSYDQYCTVARALDVVGERWIVCDRVRARQRAVAQLQDLGYQVTLQPAA